MFAFRLAAIAIIRVAHESREAVTATLMMFCHTYGVGGAGEGIADSHALEYAQNIGTTSRRVWTVFIVGTVR